MKPVIEVFATGTPAAPADASLFSLLTEAGIVVQLDLLLLIAMSVFCWAIVVQKFGRIRAATRESALFLDLFWKTKRLDVVYEQAEQFPNSPVAGVFKSGYQELAKIKSGGQTSDATENLTRALRRAAAVEATTLERYITFLATTGSTAPFIGLFGTVWGILQAFQKLGTAQQATIQVVGPDIAHALIATAVGLVAAIPAVMAYNYFNASIRVLNIEMDNFSSDFLNIVKRHLH